MKSEAAEAWGYALLLTRRVLTTALAGATTEQLHELTALGSLAECAAAVCAQEARLIWPEDLPPARLDPPQSQVEILYALVRHRAVTEELLMEATDEQMTSPHWTAAMRLAGDPETTLTECLRQLALSEFATAVKATMIRTRIDSEWSAQLELQQRAQAAIVAAVDSPAPPLGELSRSD